MKYSVKKMKILVGGWIQNFLKIDKTSNIVSLTHSLTHSLTQYLTTVASLEPSEWPPFYATTTNSPVRCAFCGSNECGLCTSLFLLSSIVLFFFMQQNQIDVQIFQSALSLSSVSRHHTINFKALALCQRYWTITDTIIRVQYIAKSWT